MTPSPYIIPGLPNRQDLPAEYIISHTCDKLGITATELRRDCRKRELAEARQIVMYLLAKQTRIPYIRIGELFNRDHATVTHACKVVRNLYKTNVDFRIKYAPILKDHIKIFA